MATPSVQVQKDNLNIGLYLCLQKPYGVSLEEILKTALGYNPQGPYPTDSFELYEKRFREAQRGGRDRFKERIPGYFTFNAMPFGSIYIYKATWYIWINPQTGCGQIVPVATTDVKAMRDLRDKDLKTRQSTTRSVRAVHNVQDQREVIARRDFQSLSAVEARMLRDGSLGELLTGLHGIPYADLEVVLPKLPRRSFGGMVFEFQKSAKRITELQGRLLKEEEKVATQLTKWVTLQTGLPSNARQLALQDAAAQLATLP